MKRRILLSCIALTCAVLGVVAQRSYTFNAVALNVDGLPKKISFVEINPDGKEEAGATELCGILASSGWDIVGFSEDFNFHTQLTAAPASTYYNFGEHGGSVNAGAIMGGADTDGLGFACSKRYSYSGGTRVAWKGFNGTTDQGADGLITKGFRVYNVTLATGVLVDVYVLHMEAEDGEKDIAVRNDQLGELASYIKNNKNGRPVIILGDTNCRYTRDQLKKNFIDVINSDSRLTIKDAWVEKMWGGEYPTYGGESMMWQNSPYNNNTGEVVDKIFYINDSQSSLTIEANSYLHDTSLGVSDHYPVIVNFTVTDKNGTPADESSWIVNDGVIVEDENMLDGCQVTDGETYFIKNVSTGLYLKSGAQWGTRACEGSAGMPITITLSNGAYRLGTLNGSIWAVTDPYMDNQGNTTWTLQEVPHTKYQYYLKISNTQALSSTGEVANSNEDYVVYCKSFDESDDKQKWVLLTEERMKEEMVARATASMPFDVTPLLKAASFDRMDIDNGYASTNWPGLTLEHWENDKADGHNGSAEYIGTSALTVSQALEAMPAGTYTVEFEGFYRAQAKQSRNSSSLTDYTMNVPVSFGSKSTNLKQNRGLDIDGDARWAFLADDTWLTSFDVTTTSKQDMTFKIAKPTFSSGYSSRQSWIAIDNIKIKYKGDGSEPENVLSVKNVVGNYINTVAQKVAQLNEKGQTAYDISNVIYRYNNESLLSADGSAEKAMIDAAYEIAVAAHKQGLIEEAMKGNGDITTLITNPSFETGDLTGWTVYRNGTDTRVASDLDAAGMDGEYLFNSWADQNYDCGLIYQDIKGLSNGYYTLQAMVASWADRKVYIIGNNQYVGVNTTADVGTFVNLSLDFLVKDGVARIGAVGGNKDGDFYYKQGIFFKCDNFRLTYKGAVGEGRVKIALADAKAKAAALPNKQIEAQFLAAVAKYENATVSGDGKAEEAAIYNALKEAIGTQPYTSTDMTWLITNPSFETGDWTGWTRPSAWDAVVLHATHGNATANGEGQYVVNVWNDHADATNSGVNAPVYQTLSGLPNGRYRLAADVTSDNGNPVAVYATTNSETVNDTIQPTNNGTFKTKSIEFDVTDHTATIGAVGYKGGVNGTFDLDGGCWYKCDNFRLTYLGHDLSLDEDETAGTINDWYTSVNVLRTIKLNTWSTFVVPFDIPASMLVEWEIKELDPANSVLNGDKITIEFIDAADGIKAGVPYMVRNTTMGGNLTEISMENIQVNTTPENTENAHVEFVGTYTNGKVPSGAFFISNNVFYQAANDNITLKAFRAYFVAKSPNARALNYRFAGEEGTTAIDELDSEVTVVGIYTLGGVRINDMQEGVNILQMSDGSVVKVVIK